MISYDVSDSNTSIANYYFKTRGHWKRRFCLAHSYTLNLYQLMEDEKNTFAPNNETFLRSNKVCQPGGAHEPAY